MTAVGTSPAAVQAPTLHVLTTPGAADYALLDSGEGRKLERFGAIVVDRPEPQALWQRRRDARTWAGAHAVFSASGEDDEKGRWRVDRPVPEQWPVRPYPAGAADRAGNVVMQCRLQGLWHLGLFPEQRPHWQHMLDRLAVARATHPDGEPPRVLNLFGYTGAASLLAAAAGAEVTHVDASRKAVAWGRDNQAASGLDAAKVRWIVDDAMKFVAREVRRGRTYDVVLLDPPKFGRGPDGEVFDLYRHVAPLLADGARLLAPGPSSLILTVYAIRASALAFGTLVAETLAARPGTLEVGELALIEAPGTEVAARGATPAETTRAGSRAAPAAGRLLPTSLYVRWDGV